MNCPHKSLRTDTYRPAVMNARESVRHTCVRCGFVLWDSEAPTPTPPAEGEGTPAARFVLLMDELERRFPDAHSPYASDPPEPRYLAAIDRLRAAQPQGETESRTFTWPPVCSEADALAIKLVREARQNRKQAPIEDRCKQAAKDMAVIRAVLRPNVAQPHDDAAGMRKGIEAAKAILCDTDKDADEAVRLAYVRLVNIDATRGGGRE